MKLLPHPGIFIGGVMLILITNIIVITGALGNRGGEPEAIVELTERELGWRNMERRENNGISLRLNAVLYVDFNWINIAKLSELGIHFDTTEDPTILRRKISKQLPQSVFVVLEFDGDAYQVDLKKAQAEVDDAEALVNLNPANENYPGRLESLQRQLAHMIHNASRLYAVDVGFDPVVLRRRYPDSTHYLIAGGLLDIMYADDRDAEEAYRGYISSINIDSIHVPLEKREVFDTLPPPKYGKFQEYPPRYTVTLAYGSRYEPWVEEVNGLGPVN